MQTQHNAMYEGRGSIAQLVWLVSWEYVFVNCEENCLQLFFQSSLLKDLERANSCEVLVCFMHFPLSVSWERPCTPWIHFLFDLFSQTKTVIDKIQKLVSSEGRFKNLREALKKWAWLFSSSQTLLSAWSFLWDFIVVNALSSAVTPPVFPTWECTWLTWPS